MKCTRCNQPLTQDNGEWDHAPCPSWRRQGKCAGPKPVLPTSKDYAIMQQVIDVAQDRDGFLIACLSIKEFRTRTALKRLVQLEWIAVRTVTYSNWDSPVYPNWGPSAHTAFEALILTPTDHPIYTEIV